MLMLPTDDDREASDASSRPNGGELANGDDTGRNASTHCQPGSKGPRVSDYVTVLDGPLANGLRIQETE